EERWRLAVGDPPGLCLLQTGRFRSYSISSSAFAPCALAALRGAGLDPSTERLVDRVDDALGSLVGAQRGDHVDHRPGGIAAGALELPLEDARARGSSPAVPVKRLSPVLLGFVSETTPMRPTILLATVSEPSRAIFSSPEGTVRSRPAESRTV